MTGVRHIEGNVVELATAAGPVTFPVDGALGAGREAGMLLAEVACLRRIVDAGRPADDLRGFVLAIAPLDPVVAPRGLIHVAVVAVLDGDAQVAVLHVTERSWSPGPVVTAYLSTDEEREEARAARERDPTLN